MEKRYICDDEQLISEWDWEENNKISLDPYQLTHGSTKRAHWICEKGHRFSARIDHRTIMKSGCPYCANKLPILGENDLATTHPHLLKEWDYENNEKKPEEYLAGSNKKVNWICEKCGNHWQTAVTHRAIKGTGCPVCMMVERGKSKTKSTLENRGSLAEEFPDIAKEWDYEKNKGISPYEVHRSSKNIVWWKCSFGHSWKASVSNRASGTGCPICAGKNIVKGFNDLESCFPDISKEWHTSLNGDLTPDSITKHSERKVWWLCPECGESYFTSVYSRTSLHTGCPICANRIVIKGKNDLATTNPEIAKEWNYLRNGDLLPTDVVAKSNKKVWWQCELGHEWEATVADRTRGRGCPICAKITRPVNRLKTYLIKKGSLSECYPEMAKQWHPTKNGNLFPDSITSGSSRKVWWICEKGHEWEAAISSRVNGRNCPYCNYEHSTSFPEQVIFYYLSQITVAVNRYKLDGRELDVFLPLYNIGIEYNGRYYHKNRVQQDSDKISFFNQNNIRVIVVHEGQIEGVDNDNIYYRYINSDYINLDYVINAIVKLCNLPKIDVDINRDRAKIYSQYVEAEKNNSLAEKYPWLIDEWDYERNGSLTPWLVSYGSKKRIHWKCPVCGYRWSAVAYSRKKSGCPQCANRVKK